MEGVLDLLEVLEVVRCMLFHMLVTMEGVPVLEVML
jgi:hypothetical protein